LLTLAQEGDAVTDPGPVSLGRVATDAWDTSDTGNATLSIDVDDGYWIRAERSRLRTLLENCFRNAVDHGGEHVTVGRVDSEENLDTKEGFFVADDGPGIPTDEREHVFEYGYSTADDGTGFGLAIVDAVASAHDWSVFVAESDTGGARFEVTGVTPAGRDEPAGVRGGTVSG